MFLKVWMREIMGNIEFYVYHNTRLSRLFLSSQSENVMNTASYYVVASAWPACDPPCLCHVKTFYRTNSNKKWQRKKLTYYPSNLIFGLILLVKSMSFKIDLSFKSIFKDHSSEEKCFFYSMFGHTTHLISLGQQHWLIHCVCFTNNYRTGYRSL